MNKASVYFPELDSLRFLAFLLVLFHHVPFAKNIQTWAALHDYGWMGVDLFLCLSAFLFAKLLFVEYQERGDINVRYFYLRRLLRIWPLYFFFLGLMLAYSALIHGWQAHTWIRSLGLFTFTDNFFAMAYDSYNKIPYADHLWTISYEEQFYLIIPWALRFLYRLKGTTVAYILGGVLLFGLLIRAIFIRNEVGYLDIWVFPLTHFESIIGGLILGLGVFDKYLNKISSWIYLFAGLIALGLVTALPNVQIVQWRLMYTYLLVGLGVSFLLLAAIRGGLGPISAMLKLPTLRYLGKISYGLYVYHLLGRALAITVTQVFVTPERALVYPIVVLITSLIVTVLISMLSYEILEKAFLKMKEGFTLIYSRPV
jgi:peptidoglycan/LPS O-acetylase OafA/YrhL